MMAADKDALLCDLAETYGVFDLRALPVKTLAALAFGLRANARIKRKLAGAEYSTDTLLLASMRDSLAWLVWAKSKDAERGVNRPVSIVDTLLHGAGSGRTHGFDTAAEFDAARARILADMEEVASNGNESG